MDYTTNAGACFYTILLEVDAVSPNRNFCRKDLDRKRMSEIDFWPLTLNHNLGSFAIAEQTETQKILLSKTKQQQSIRATLEESKLLLQ